MRRRDLLAASPLLAAAVLAGGCGSAETIVIRAYVEEAFRPYTIRAIAQDQVTGQRVTDFTDPVATAEYERILVYTPGNPVRLDVTITTSKAGSTAGYVRLINGARRQNYALQRRSTLTVTMTVEG